MNSRTDSEYRLRLASEARDAAQGAFDRQDWPVCVQQAQLAVENAAKAVLATQGPVPQTREPAEHLNDLLAAADDLPDTISGSISDLVAACYALGSREHILASYGDESARLTPRELFDETRAEGGLRTARSAVGHAERLVRYFTRMDDSEVEKTS